MDWTEILDRLAAAFFPQRCLFCERVVAYDDFWCAKCGETGKSPCLSLGRVDCEFPRSFAEALAALEYADNARSLILRIKDTADKRVAQFLAGEMRGVMAKYWDGIKPDIAVPVPAAASTLKERGFNQAEMLARYLSGYMGIPVCGDALIRREVTRIQHTLTAAERRVNAEKSYDIGNPAEVSGKTVLLVDDVFTTGSTAAACSDKLLEAGAVCVYVITASGRRLQ